MSLRRFPCCLSLVVAFLLGAALTPAAAADAEPAPGASADPWRALRLAVADLSGAFGERYPRGEEYLARLAALQEERDRLAHPDQPAGDESRAARERLAEQFAQLQREALLDHPLLSFDRLLLVKRSPAQMGLPMNWQGNSCLPMTGYDNEVAQLELAGAEGKLSTVYRPEGGRFVGDLELHYDADRLLFSIPGKNGRWQVNELRLANGELRELPLVPDADVDNYDACYLPDGNVIFCSTATFVGVPCVTGSSHVGNLFRYETATGAIRQLTFEQDHDWCPTVLPNGRVLYLRWEYSDLPHFVSRILFQMNPDGTEQAEYYGSNSYWPNSLFYARPTPNHPGKFVGVVGGHHDAPRMGELVLFDTAQGTHEADGAVQRIPGHGKKVEPIIRDELIRHSWPKFLHPWPLSDKYFLVSAQPREGANWGVYLVDVFDNMLLLKEEDGYALLEPTPVAPRPKPPVIPSRVKPERRDATVYLADVYAGPGLAGIPRGTVKKLRLFTYHFAYRGVGGQVHRVGLDGPWDVKRVLGVVPVEADGSAYFRAPANTPISVQPLDGEGKALQLMRSWMTAMPGETVSCNGCHDRRHNAAPDRSTLALTKPPAEIAPWYGPVRGFSFQREVQPVLDRHCVGCHNGQPGEDGQPCFDLRTQPYVHAESTSPHYARQARFPPAYLALKSFVRTPTIESDMHLLTPGEFHADTTKLVQLLRGGHYGVELDAEAWDRLITWIDLNTPAHGAWNEIVGYDHIADPRRRRQELLRRYANRDEDPEAPVETPPYAGGGADAANPADASSHRHATVVAPVSVPGWPFDAAEAARRQQAAGPSSRTIDLGGGVRLELIFIPPGEFVMGDPEAHPEEGPSSQVHVKQGFWIGRLEITNEQYRLFEARHDSRYEEADFLQFSEEERGYRMSSPQQPVVRVSWRQAMAFCQWLSEKTGESFTLPTEAQWEYACRAGAATPLAYGAVEDDFSSWANLADASLRKVDLFSWGLPVGAIPPWRPADANRNDGFRVSAPVGRYQPNAWGLHDMHGNVAEWTRTAHRPYPYSEDDGRNDLASQERRVVRGGSWDDRPHRARSSFRLSYWPYQQVYDVGFRVLCQAEPAQSTPSH